jgi:hypothetical protein
MEANMIVFIIALFSSATLAGFIVFQIIMNEY